MEFKEIKGYAHEVSQTYGMRNQINLEMEKLYWMRWDERTKVAGAIGDVAKITHSPRAANAVDGMIRLLCASDPIFSLPNEINAPFTKANGEAIEKFCAAMWQASGKISGKPTHYDVVRSAILFDEIHILIQSTTDLVKAAKQQKGGKSRIARAEEIAQRTPFMYKVTHPSAGYPVWDEMGLCFFYSKRKVKHSDIITAYGKKGEEVIQRLGSKQSPYTEAELHDAYDLENRCVWIDGSDEPLVFAPHGFPFIPVVATRVEGSDLFAKPEEQRHPALYNLYKSGIIERQNLFLTVLYTMVFAIGANPMFVEYLHNPNNPPEIDYSKPGYTARMRIGERREPMARQVVDPALLQSWQIAQELEMESTIYRQTLGEPLGANAPYSMVALLSQSGRLPLLMAQRMGGEAIGKAVELSLKIAKKEGIKGKVNSSGIYAILNPKDIPDFFEVQAKLDIAMPQDLLNNVNAAVMGTQGDNPLFDMDYAREKLLQIGQPQEMQKAIWDQKIESIFYQKYVSEQMAAMAQARQAAMAPPTNASGMPGMPAAPGGMDTPQNMGTPTLGQPSKPFPNIPSPYEPAQPMIPPDQGVPPEGM